MKEFFVCFALLLQYNTASRAPTESWNIQTWVHFTNCPWGNGKDWSGLKFSATLKCPKLLLRTAWWWRFSEDALARRNLAKICMLNVESVQCIHIWYFIQYFLYSITVWSAAPQTTPWGGPRPRFESRMDDLEAETLTTRPLDHHTSFF